MRRWHKPNGDKVRIGTYTIGVLVQANQGMYKDLAVRGVPVGQFLKPPDVPGRGQISRRRKSSIIVVIATDAPLVPHQLKRLAHGAAHGIARTGTITNQDSGEISIAFSIANSEATDDDRPAPMSMIPNDSLDPLLGGVVEATEEAILNALVTAETMFGRNGKHKATAIIDMTNPSLVDIMKRFNRWVHPQSSQGLT